MTETLLFWLSWPFFLAGAFFFIAGTVGLVRFPDIYSRLHAVTKADTLGLGFVIFGLALRNPDIQAVVIMVLIWLLVLASSATACQILARFQHEADARPTTDTANQTNPSGGPE